MVQASVGVQYWGKNLPSGSVVALRGNVFWLWGATGSHCTTNLTQEIYWERHRWWLPMLHREAAGIWAEGKFYKGFLRAGFSRIGFPWWGLEVFWVLGSVGLVAFQTQKWGWTFYPKTRSQQRPTLLLFRNICGCSCVTWSSFFLLNLFWSDFLREHLNCW